MATSANKHGDDRHHNTWCFRFSRTDAKQNGRVFCVRVKFRDLLLRYSEESLPRPASKAKMLRRLALPLVNRAGHRLSSTMIPDEHLDKFDPENPNYTKFEVVSDPEIWSYVERLMPVSKIALPPNKPGPSGWQPVKLTKEEVSRI